ncbi:hypothetical protein [Paenibacillus chibensis]|uniref:hypothetical protein n=1 Tax=Paenibacillus chibensis TaxID=59846 RepID=UPI001FEA5E19|nr:hypothetical protein [Paenibacillus chibensis]MEC0371282.1 hypothetical protein [Paenibacillus chibensis]
MNVFESQYELIQRTRESLFRYCETFSHADYVQEVKALGGISIRSLHAHVADCYKRADCKNGQAAWVYSAENEPR